MLEARRTKVLRAMVGVLIVFGASLIYFLFFNTGLELVSDPSDQYGKVIVSNASVHLIRSIDLSYLKNGTLVKIETIPALNPGEHHVVLLKPEFVDQGKFTIQVSAPFHLGKQVLIDARSLDPGVINARYSFQYPTLGIVGMPVISTVDACNDETFPLDASVSLQFVSPVSESTPSSLPLFIPPNSCASTSIAFTPQAAYSTLSFKIRVSTPTSVLVEKMHTLPIEAPPSVPAVDANASSNDVNADLNGGI